MLAANRLIYLNKFRKVSFTFYLTFSLLSFVLITKAHHIDPIDAGVRKPINYISPFATYSATLICFDKRPKLGKWHRIPDFIEELQEDLTEKNKSFILKEHFKVSDSRLKDLLNKNGKLLHIESHNSHLLKVHIL